MPVFVNHNIMNERRQNVKFIWDEVMQKLRWSLCFAFLVLVSNSLINRCSH